MIKRFAALLCVGLTLLGGAAWADTAETAVVPADFSKQFAGRFLKEGEAPVVEDMAYRSQDVSIEIKTYREMNSDVYVADIYLRHLSDLRRGFGGGAWNGRNQKQQRVVDIALQENAILALTGDNAHNFSTGIVYVNGVRHRKTNPKRQMCVLFADGEMKTYKSTEITIKKLEKTGKAVWQTFLFGPALLDENGKSTAIPCDDAGYMDIAPEDRGENVRRETCLTLEEMGISTERSFHEEGPGQNEIDIPFAGALAAADNAMTFQRVVKTVAHRNGLAADFSPKPLADYPGNGFYINVSLRPDSKETDLSHMIAGILRHYKSFLHRKLTI